MRAWIVFILLLIPVIVNNFSTTAIIERNLPSSNTWSKTFGRFFSDEIGFSVDTTSDGGYIVVGTAYYSRGGGIWLMKLDSYGDVEWKKVFGGFGVTGMYVKQTSDSGYVIVTGDMRVIKTDDRGNIEWMYTPSVECWCWGDRLVQETSDGGFIVVGTLEYEDSIDCDVWLVKLDSNGNMVWNKTFGGVYRDFGSSICLTFDGGFIIAGGTYSFSSNPGYDMSLWIIKTDGCGNMIWNRTYGEGSSRGFSIQETTGGGYIVAGEGNSWSEGGWVVKTNEYGNMEWDLTLKSYGCTIVYSVEETSNGKYILTGGSSGFAQSSDLYLIKINKDGAVEWVRCYGRDGYYEIGNCIRETMDDGYIVVGYKQLLNVYTGINPRFLDIWVLKTDRNGYCDSLGTGFLYSYAEGWL